jgi:hypothetical protein
VSVANSLALITSYDPMATVTADWYMSDVSASGFNDTGSLTNRAMGGTNSWDSAAQNWANGTGLLVATNTLVYHPTNRICGTYIYYARARVINPTFSGCVCQSTNLTPVVFRLIPPVPTGSTWATNCALANQFGECQNPALAVTVLTNADNLGGRLTVDWYKDANAQTYATNYGGVRGTNSLTFIPPDINVGIYTYWVETRDTNSQYVSTNLLAVNFRVEPLPLAPVALPTYVTNVLTLPYQTNGTLTVSGAVPAGSDPGVTVTADWYTDSNGVYVAGSVAPDQAYGATNNWLAGGGVIPAIGTTTFIPTNRLYGTYTYWVRARVVNPNFTYCSCQSTNLTPVTFVLIPPAPPTLAWTTQGSPATNLVFSWFGNFWLQTATNLTPPVNWMNDITNASPGVTNTVDVPVELLPEQFFRLYLPSN